jgi:hypothetical protein
MFFIGTCGNLLASEESMDYTKLDYVVVLCKYHSSEEPKKNCTPCLISVQTTLGYTKRDYVEIDSYEEIDQQIKIASNIERLTALNTLDLDVLKAEQKRIAEHIHFLTTVARDLRHARGDKETDPTDRLQKSGRTLQKLERELGAIDVEIARRDLIAINQSRKRIG